MKQRAKRLVARLIVIWRTPELLSQLSKQIVLLARAAKEAQDKIKTLETAFTMGAEINSPDIDYAGQLNDESNGSEGKL